MTADAGVRTGAGWIGVTADRELRPPLAIAEAAPTGVSAGRLPRAERAGDVLPRFGVPLRRLMAGAAPRNCCGARYAQLRVPIIAGYGSSVSKASADTLARQDLEGVSTRPRGRA